MNLPFPLLPVLEFEFAVLLLAHELRELLDLELRLVGEVLGDLHGRGDLRGIQRLLGLCACAALSLLRNSDYESQGANRTFRCCCFTTSAIRPTGRSSGFVDLSWSAIFILFKV